MLDIFGGGLLLLAFWFGFVLLFSLLSGCGYLVADNPACLYECSSHYQWPTGGGAN